MREAYEVAVGLLARREHSVRQLNQKLAKRGFDEPAISSALESCQRLNLQSDTRFAEATCRSRINRGYGPLMIKQLLQHEGVAPNIIEQVFDEINQNRELANEVQTTSKVFPSLGKKEAEKIKGNFEKKTPAKILRFNPKTEKYE